MSRILNESGEYAPEAVPTFSGPIVPPVDPRGLPQVKKDPYANVDPADFSTAGSMTREQVLAMGDIASRRGLSDLAMKWKSIAMAHQRRDESRVEVEAMLESWKPENRQVPRPGSQIEPVRAQTPWDQDETYQAIESQVATATADPSWMADPESRIKVSRLQDDLADRKAETRLEAEAAGHWGEQAEATHEAHKSMAEKGQKVVDMLRS